MARSSVLTIGTFDLFHHGHLRLFERADEIGELWVGVNTDEFVTKYKGRPPVNSLRKRMSDVLATGLATRVITNDGPGRFLILRKNPDYLVIGSDWAERDYHAQIDVTAEELEEADIELVYLPRTEGISTTMLREVTA